MIALTGVAGRSQDDSFPLRVLVVAPRYHSQVVGGSELYLRALCEGMAARGARVDVVTTHSMGVDMEDSDAVRWQRQAPPGPELGPVKVHRYESGNLSPGAKRRMRRIVSRALAKGADRATLDEGGRNYLKSGFYPIEQNGTQRPFRWTAGSATIALGAKGITEVHFDLHAMNRVEVVFCVGEEVLQRTVIEPGAWRRVEVPLPEPAPRALELRTTPVLRPGGDTRSLGVAVGAIRCVADTGEQALPLEHDEQWLLNELPTDQVAAGLDARARLMPWRSGYADARLKGPWGARLAWAALRLGRRADVVLATNAPYATLGLGWLSARFARCPFVALPFFHLCDPFHHRPQVRGVLARADAVFCLSETTRRFIETSWRVPAVVLGAGVDPEEFARPETSGSRFRARYGLENSLIVLQVGRKAPSKGYKMTAEAVARLADRGWPVRFVLIGPDEDGEPFSSPSAQYLGKVKRAELLDALAGCDVFALPSTNESFGLAYLEAWMFGKPVIAHSRCDAARELIRAGVDGELVADVDEMTDALERILGDSSYRAELGERGRTKAAQTHSWDSVVDRACTALRSLVPGSA